MSDRPADHGPRRAGAAALAVAAIAALAVTGCGGGGAAATSGPTSTSAGGPGTAPSGQGTTTSTGSGNVFGGQGSAAKGHTIADVLNAVLASGDPAKACGTDYVTAHYLSAAYGGKQGCDSAQTPQSAARSVSIQGFAGGSGKPDTASVKVMPHGGVYDGEKLTVTLVKEGQDWKLDALKSNAPVGP